MRKAVKKLQAEVPSGQPDDIVAELAMKLTSDTLKASQTTPGAKSVNLWFNAEASKDVQRWVMSYNSSSITAHASFVAVSAAVTKRLHMDTQPGDDFGVQSLSLADLCFTFADAIFENVPTAMPALSTAVCVKVSEIHPEKNFKEELPDFCHFLCETVNVKVPAPDASVA